MSGDRPFQIALCILYSCYTLLRTHYRRVARRPWIPARQRGLDSILLAILIPYEVLGFAVYLLAPEWLAWGALPLLPWLRWAGLVPGVAGLGLFWWTHHSLGANFARSLQIRAGHSLVMSGPYRWVRHPMYAAFYLLHLAAFFLSANALLGVTWIAGLTLVLGVRVRREERMMLDAFGLAYRQYMAQTGRFPPRLAPHGKRGLRQTLPVPNGSSHPSEDCRS
jgi:protein-S-isoprenylcysteine O-methyltransferase Ste14